MTSFNQVAYAFFKVVSDPEYMVAIKAVKLKRQVEMFQWVEHKSER